MSEYVGKYLDEKARADRLEKVLADFLTEKEVRRSSHLKDVEGKNRKLRFTVRNMQLKAEELNRLNYATGLIVNCTGCDAGGPFDGNSLTEDRVQAVERIARRLRTWFNNHRTRVGEAQKP